MPAYLDGIMIGIIRQISGKLTLLMDSDKMIREYDFIERFRFPYQAGITEEVERPCKMAAALHGLRCKIIKPMVNHTTVFQDEIHDIELCVGVLSILDRGSEIRTLHFYQTARSLLKS